MAGQEFSAGKLLVATPDLDDPNFSRTVLFMIEHSNEGALGVVLNRPTAALTLDVVPKWADLTSDPPLIFHGGPVGGDGIIALGETEADTDTTEGFQRFGENNLGTVDLNLDPKLTPLPLRKLRLFAGHSGWGAGQLEGELRRGGWYVLEAEHADVFSQQPEGLWYEVLGRQKGTLSWLRHYPDDAALN